MLPESKPETRPKPFQDKTQPGAETDSTLPASLESPFHKFDDPRSRPLKHSEILHLQQTIGNRAVLRLIAANNQRFSSSSKALRNSRNRPGGGPTAGVIIQRVPAQIDPASLVAYRQFSDDTNINAVFKLEFKDGTVIVIKHQGAKATSGEILSGKILEAEKMPGLNVPDYRVLNQEEEQGIKKKLIELATAKDDKVALDHIKQKMGPGNNQMLAMDFMENSGMLPKSDKAQLYAKDGALTPDGLARLRNIGKLYAFQYFIKGADRFLTPDTALGSTTGGNQANLMMSGQTTAVQAIDTTLDMSLHRYGGDKAKKEAFLNSLNAHMDELIFNPGGTDNLTKALEKFLNIEEMDDNGRKMLRAGFLDAMKLIGQTNVDIGELIDETLAMLPKTADTDFADQSVRASFTELLTGTQKIFSEKTALLDQVEQATQAEEDTGPNEMLGILKIAAKLRSDAALDATDTKFLKDRSQTPSREVKKRKKQWPAGLTELETSKNGLKKSTKGVVAEKLKELMSKIISFGQAQLGKIAAGLLSDFVRISSKLILRAVGVKY